MYKVKPGWDLQERVFQRELDGASRAELLAVSRDQLAAYYRNVPFGSIANIFNALLVAAAFWRSADHFVAVSWVAAVIGAAALHMRERARGLAQGDELDARRELVANVPGSLLIGILWGAAVVYLAPLASGAQLVILGIVAAGMLNGGLHSLRPVPNIAVAFLVPLAVANIFFFVTLGLKSSLLDGAIMIALNLSYVAVLHHLLYNSFADFATQSLGRIRARESAETVSLLLKDYEDQGADWLWEIDQNGLLGACGRTFADAAQRPAELLDGSELAQLFKESPEREALKRHIRHNRGFRDLTVPLLVRGEERWWTLSARPRTKGKSVIGLRGVATDVTQSRQAEARIAYMAHYDSLTGLPNRFLFNETFARLLSDHKRRHEDSGIAVFYIDLDNFKGINDTLGHPVGDELLRRIGTVLEGCAGEGDMVARLGGDEFAILRSPAGSEADLARLAADVLAAIATPIAIDGNHLLPTASIGIAVGIEAEVSVTELLRHADLALYSSKENGRNQWSFFHPAMDLAAQKRREIEINLREALNKRELSLSYQPLVDIKEGHRIGYEALMRWTHPELGVIAPDDFIPVAEETGLIIQLGEWVIREAIAQAARWSDDISVSINLSPAQMRSAGLISTIVNALAENQVAPQRIEFEITESVLMHDSEANFAILHKLREIGVAISLDDFGTGYCSLNYLRSFPFDKIKIDRSFVDEVDSSGECRAIVQSVVQLAASLGMKTTAEGVERSTQLEWLQQEGCLIGQGYLFSPAIPSRELTDLRLPRRRLGDGAEPANPAFRKGAKPLAAEAPAASPKRARGR